MKARSRLAVAPFAVFLVLLVLLGAGLGRDPSKLPSPLIGKPLPLLSLPGLEGGTVTSDEFSGQAWMLNVWASWCITCRVEVPYLLRMRDEGVLIVGLDYKDDSMEAKAWLEQFGDPFVRNAVDTDGSFGLDLGVYGVPETFVIDTSGTIVYKHVGAIDSEEAYAAMMGAWEAASRTR